MNQRFKHLYTTVALLWGCCCAVVVAQVPAPIELRTSPQAGLPRAWEAGVQVSPYSAANLYNGNAITELPLAEFGTLGPLVRFTLFHNSSAAASAGVIPSPAGFSLGPGWIIAYAGAIIDNADGTVTLLEDDGNQYLFTFQNGTWQPQTGVHDTLIWDAGTSRWILTRPDQWRRVFDGAGRLLEVQDAAGKFVRVDRDPANNHRITAVVMPRFIAASATGPCAAAAVFPTRRGCGSWSRWAGETRS